MSDNETSIFSFESSHISETNEIVVILSDIYMYRNIFHLYDFLLLLSYIMEKLRDNISENSLCFFFESEYIFRDVFETSGVEYIRRSIY